MRILMWYFFVLIAINAALKINAKSRQKAKLAGDDPLRAYNEVVQNLIKNWESPVVFLRDRGFLPKNFEDTSKIKPNLDALMQRIERAKRNQPIIKIQHREMREIKRPRNHRGFGATSGSMLSNLEQLKALDSKGKKSKSRANDQELQLLAMKRRLEQLQQGAETQDPPGFRRQIKLMPRAKDPVKSAQSYDEVLQRMIEKTSPHFKQRPNLHLDKVASSKEDKLLHSAPLSLIEPRRPRKSKMTRLNRNWRPPGI
ncbi:uncharacterized protein [Drosophila takahashii]|uniref:uncharacterized protein isoform X2 n=1 Tax=Drosophila takahashii TaxID=29030 RepID=UPI003898DA05